MRSLLFMLYCINIQFDYDYAEQFKIVCFFTSDPLTLPLFADRVACGFPSPAQDYVESRLDIGKLLVRHPNATYFVRASGESMIGVSGWRSADRRQRPDAGARQYRDRRGGRRIHRQKLQRHPDVRLLPMNPAYAPIVFDDEAQLEIFGVVTFIVYAAR